VCLITGKDRNPAQKRDKKRENRPENGPIERNGTTKTKKYASHFQKNPKIETSCNLDRLIKAPES
jgi:hypothetical protein